MKDVTDIIKTKLIQGGPLGAYPIPFSVTCESCSKISKIDVIGDTVFVELSEPNGDDKINVNKLSHSSIFYKEDPKTLVCKKCFEARKNNVE